MTVGPATEGDLVRDGTPGTPHEPTARWLRMAVALTVTAISGWCVLTGLDYGVGTLAAPGAGAFPVIAGSLGLVSGVVVAIESLLDIGDARGPLEHVTRRSRSVIVGYIAVLVLFPLLLERAGFFLAALATGVGTARLAGQRNWLWCGATSLGMTTVIYLGVTRVLGVPLPGLMIGG